METAEALSKLGIVPQIQEQKYIINKVRIEGFWEDVDILESDEVRQALRGLLFLTIFLYYLEVEIKM